MNNIIEKIESEFCFNDSYEGRENYYENSIIYKCIYSTLNQGASNKVNLSNFLISQIISRYNSVKKKIQPLIVGGYYSALQIYNEIIIESKGDNPIELKRYIPDIIECEDSFADIKDKESLVALVNAFFDLCQKAVFSPQNDVLVDGRFGKSDLINKLICPIEKSRIYDSIECYKYNLNDPFVAAALIRIANNIENRLNSTNRLNDTKKYYGSK